MSEKFIECVSWEKMRKFEVDFGFLHLFVYFGDSICMETLFWCTYVRMNSVANDCAGTGVLRYIYLVRLESFLFKKYDMYGCN